MRVENLNVSKQIACSSASWLTHWEKISGQNAYLCFVKDCINRPSIGGLVQKGSGIDHTWYIVPLCDECSRKTGQELDIWDMAALVRADDAESALSTGRRRRE